ncbi:MAG: dTDP-4-dehydrorhamnose reductase [Parvicellaceae bacterium]|jgi:dTDP-4-dehydrorhamnose reductase
MSKRTILITGSNGLLGQKLIHQLTNNKEFELIATAKGDNRVSGSGDFRYLELDITNRDEVLRVITSECPDVVINTAAMTNVDACETLKDDCWNLNVKAVEYLVEACTITDSHFMQLSTDFVFDGLAGPYAETDKPNPISFYGWSKYASELSVEMSELKNWSIVRTIIIYGLVEDMSRSNVVLWAKQAMEKGSAINVVDDQFRSPTLAEDLAAGCILIADQKAKGIFHLSGKETMSILDLVYKVGEFFNLDTSIVKPIKSASLNQAAKRPPRTGFVIDKAIKELGYKPKSFTEGLEMLNSQLKEKEL